MRALQAATLVLAGLLGLTAASTVLAHPPRSRAQIGFYVGVPIAWPYWNQYPYYYYPSYRERIVVVPAEPTVYVQRPDAAPAHQPGYWYYCAEAEAYYPYVKECASGWQRVAPQPADR